MTGGNDPDNRRDFPGGWKEDPRNAFEAGGRSAEPRLCFRAGGAGAQWGGGCIIGGIRGSDLSLSIP